MVLALQTGSVTEDKKNTGNDTEAAQQQVETRDQIILAQQRIIADLQATMPDRR